MDMETRAAEAAAKIHGMIVSDLSLVVARDESFLMAVCAKLDLNGSDVVNRSQVALLLAMNDTSTLEEYPKWIKPLGDDGPSILVEDAGHESKVRSEVASKSDKPPVDDKPSDDPEPEKSPEDDPPSDDPEPEKSPEDDPPSDGPKPEKS